MRIPHRLVAVQLVALLFFFSTGVSGQSIDASNRGFVQVEGLLRTAAGAPITVPLEVKFAVYAQRDDVDPLWQEVQTVAPDLAGRYSALLGLQSPGFSSIDLFLSGEPRWLGVTNNGVEIGSRAL